MYENVSSRDVAVDDFAKMQIPQTLRRLHRERIRLRRLHLLSLYASTHRQSRTHIDQQ
jgi:hypothetical protein